MAKSRYEVEEMILGMADIVMENRMLREEVTELKEIRDEYYHSINERYITDEETNRKIMSIALSGMWDRTKSSNERLLEMVDCMHVEV